jgi:hypothetical protein
MKVAFALWNAPKSFHANAVRPVFEWHQKQGHDVRYVSYGDGLEHRLRDTDLVYLWNGEYEWLWGVKESIRRRGGKTINIEVAWFPQDENTYYDWRGTNGNCSLRFDSLDWLEPADYDNLDALSEKYREGLTPTEEGYVLVPLQLAKDTAVQKWSPLKRMGGVIRMARKMFPHKEILFRRHPLDGHDYADLIDDITLGEKRPLKELIMGADLVWGMNSTVLTEAALMGKKVQACGTSLLHIGSNQRDALAALVARQIPMDVSDVTPWIRRGRGLEHLALL